MDPKAEKAYSDEDVNIFKHESEAEQNDLHRVFNGASALIALAHWAPENVQTVEEIEGGITFFPGSLLELNRRTGLKEKHICDKDTRVIDLAMKAVDELIMKKTYDGRPIPLEEIDLIIYFSGISREYEEPATAVLIQDRLGLSGQMAFDVSDACMGFIDAWCIADAMIATKRIRMALLVSAEKTSVLSENALKIVNAGGDIMDQFSSFTMADGAVAAVIGPQSSGTKGINLMAGARESYGEYNSLCFLKSYFEGIMRSQPKQLFEAALSKFLPVTEAVLSRLDWNKDTIDLFITHQPAIPAMKKGAEMLGVSYEKAGVTFPEYGNIGAVSVPFTLSFSLAEQTEWKKQRIMCIALASGIGIGVLGLETYDHKTGKV